MVNVGQSNLGNSWIPIVTHSLSPVRECFMTVQPLATVSLTSMASFAWRVLRRYQELGHFSDEPYFPIRPFLVLTKLTTLLSRHSHSYDDEKENEKDCLHLLVLSEDHSLVFDTFQRSLFGF